VKLVIAEPETGGLRRLLESHPDQFASAIVEVEVVRAVAHVARERVADARRVVAQLPLVELTETIRGRASLLDPPTLRSLDAIHLATALAAGDDLDGVVTYDSRLASTAAAHGLDVLAPS
jgi:predicted nucleic acid-binding protein